MITLMTKRLEFELIALFKKNRFSMSSSPYARHAGLLVRPTTWRPSSFLLLLAHLQTDYIAGPTEHGPLPEDLMISPSFLYYFPVMGLGFDGLPEGRPLVLS